jgi:hypothetical protein
VRNINTDVDQSCRAVGGAHCRTAGRPLPDRATRDRAANRLIED